MSTGKGKTLTNVLRLITIPVSKTIRSMCREYEDSFWPSVAYFSGTYFEVSSPLLPRIDYLFHSPSLIASGPRVIRHSHGDHYPVLAAFQVVHGNQDRRNST